MREGLFIKKNKDRWEQIEVNKAIDADETASNFTRLVNDLGYAKTFYPTSRITAYLNKLASGIYLRIYQNRKDPVNRLAKFFRYDVPLAVAKHYRVMLVCFALFFIFASVGFFSAKNDPAFMREILSDEYVDMTEKNIEEGNPFNVYASQSPFIMFIEIMINNIRVSLFYFFQGLALGIFSVTALCRESIRIGAFEYMFYAKGLGGYAVVTVLLHGLLELTAIILTCGAGVVMGTSWLFPKTRSRFAAFQAGVKDGVKIVIGLIPVFMIAAFIEGYVTRHYKMHILMSSSILAVCALALIGYFVIYPVYLVRRKRIAFSETDTFIPLHEH